MTRRTVFLIAIFLMPLICLAQQSEFLLDGFVYIKNGPKCRYKVTLKVDGSNVTGTSSTIQPLGLELNAFVKGHINRKKQELTFTEFKMPLAIDLNNCMFDVTLNYKIIGDNYLFSGTFVGNSDAKDTCDEGTVMMAIDKNAGSSFVQGRKQKKIQEVKKEVPEEKTELPAEYEKITATVKKHLVWNSDSIVLEIWDGMVIDGDIVTVKVDGMAVLTKYELVKEKKRIVVPVKGRTCNITIYAENEGTAPPNTSMILLTDGKTTHGAEAVLHRGETAEIDFSRK